MWAVLREPGWGRYEDDDLLMLLGVRPERARAWIFFECCQDGALLFGWALRTGVTAEVTRDATRHVTWTSIETAAQFLGLSSAALRKALERRAVRAPDGGIEAELDGVRGRKLGRLWRVCLSASWAAPPERTLQPAEATRNDRKDNRS